MYFTIITLNCCIIDILILLLGSINTSRDFELLNSEIATY